MRANGAVHASHNRERDALCSRLKLLRLTKLFRPKNDPDTDKKYRQVRRPAHAARPAWRMGVGPSLSGLRIAEAPARTAAGPRPSRRCAALSAAAAGPSRRRATSPRERRLQFENPPRPARPLLSLHAARAAERSRASPRSPPPLPLLRGAALHLISPYLATAASAAKTATTSPSKKPTKKGHLIARGGREARTAYTRRRRRGGRTAWAAVAASPLRARTCGAAGGAAGEG